MPCGRQQRANDTIHATIHAWLRPLLIPFIAVMVLVGPGCSASKYLPESNDDRDALAKTREAVRAAFARGDVATILAYHHPDVVKALS
jgi:hypothetical protein